MAEPPAPSPTATLAERIAAAQAWWREAGVDLAYSDAPQAWLAEPAAAEEPAPAPRAPVAAAPPPAPAVDRAAWPQDLAAFRAWWLEEPSLDDGGAFSRVAPRGEAGAAVMLLVPMPEAEDRDTLLSGPHGRLLGSLVQAMGLAPEQVYWAAALPRHTALPDWSRLAARGHGELLRHHLALARPKRLIVLGRDVSSLLGHDPAQSAPAVSELAIQGGQLPVLATYSPARLLQRAPSRAALWQRWLDWTDGDNA